MTRFYVIQIKLGKITLEDVPARWYESVKAVLESGTQ